MRAHAAEEESSSFKAVLVLGLVLLLNVFLYLFYLRHANDVATAAAAAEAATNLQQQQQQQQEQDTIRKSTAEWQAYFSERRVVQESQTCDHLGTCVCFLVRVGPRHAKSIPALVWGLLASRNEDFGRIVLMEVEVPRFMPYLLKIHNQTRNDPRVIVSPELPVVNTYGFEQVNNEIDRLVAEGRCSHFIITSGDYLYTHPFMERVTVKMDEYEYFMQCEYVSRGNRFQVTKGVPMLGVSIVSRELLRQNPEIRFQYKDLPAGLLDRVDEWTSVVALPWIKTELDFIAELKKQEKIPVDDFWWNEVHIYVR